MTEVNFEEDDDGADFGDQDEEIAAVDDPDDDEPAGWCDDGSDAPATKVTAAPSDPIDPAGHPSGELAAVFAEVRRKSAIDIGRDLNAKSTVFQLWTIDYVCAQPKDGVPWPPWTLGRRRPDMVPVVRICGVTKDGLSVRAHIFGYEPHFFCESPPEARPENPEWVEAARAELDAKASEIVRHERENFGKRFDRPAPKWKRRADSEEGWPVVTRLEFVRRRMIRGYSRTASWFMHVTTRLPRHVPTVRKILESGGSLCAATPALKTYEADVPFDLRFMLDKGMTGCDWIAIDAVDSHADDSAFGCHIIYHAKIDPLRIGGDDSWGNLMNRACEADAAADEVADISAKMAGVARTAVRRRCAYDVGDDVPPRVRPTEDDSSRCSIEIDAWHGDVRSLGVNGEWAIHAPVKLLSFDVECGTEKDRFPSAEDGDPAITICSKIGIAEGDARDDVGVALQLRSCDRVQAPGVRTVWFDDEASLLMAWRDLVVQSDPDIITGFNDLNFDFPYLLKRAEKLGIGKRFADFSRVRGELAKCAKSNFSSKAVGTLDNNEVKVAGRLIHDVRQVAQRTLKLKQYTLNAVAAFAVGDQKIELDHHEIPKIFFHGTAADRKVLATYCMKDCELPPAIMRKLMMTVNDIEMARATNVPVVYLHTRGMQIRVIALELREALAYGYIVDSAAPRGARRNAGDLGKKYEGAVVLNAERGLYEETVSTLDFASLYPSIMLSTNMCYTTLLEVCQLESVHPSNRWKSPIGVWFAAAPKMLDKKAIAAQKVDASKVYENPNGTVSLRGGETVTLEVAKALKLEEGADYVASATDPALVVLDSQKEHGLLPKVLMGLLSRRKQAKYLLSIEQDPGKRAVYDGRQLALKVCANSVYGSTGFEGGRLPEQRIAASVTARGRELIEYTRDMVHEKFCLKNGYPANAHVIYGDTDSVMVTFRPEVPTGKEAALVACDCVVARVCDSAWGKFLKTPAAAGSDEATRVATRAKLVAAVKGEAERAVGEFASERYGGGWTSIAKIGRPSQAEIFAEAHACAAGCIAAISKPAAYAAEAISGFVPPPEDIEKRASEDSGCAVDMVVVERASALGREACAHVNSKLPRPLSIEFEKTWLRFLLSSKKRYAGIKCLEDPKTKKMVRKTCIDAMGMETVRRDVCDLVRMSVAGTLGDIFIRHDIKLAVRNARAMFAELMHGDVAIDKLIITKSMSKKKSPFATKQPHVDLAERMRARGDTRYAIGDRVRMVFVDRGKKDRGQKTKSYVKSEDPMRAAIEDIPIDREYYVENQLTKPLLRLFECVVPVHPEYILDPDIDVEDALRGRRTKRPPGAERTKIRVVQPPPSKDSSSIGRFLQRSGMPCLGCGAAVATRPDGSSPATCPACKEISPALCARSASELAEAERIAWSIKSHCSRCARRVMGAMACASEECPLAYAKIRAQKNLARISEVCDRFKDI
jgi:DNA polymerase elongation subunit (family B)